jgi:hypothetical protein
VACIPVHPGHIEDQASLWQKYRHLQAQGATAWAQADESGTAV